MNISLAIETLQSHYNAAERRNAAEFLSSIEPIDENIMNAFINALDDNDNGVKDICFYTLTNINPDCYNTLAKNLSPGITSQSTEKRNLIADLLIKIGKEALNPLFPYLEHDDPAHRQFACDIIGRIPEPSSAPIIFKLINDDNNNVASSAIEAIGNLEYQPAFDKLTEIYPESEDLQPVIINSIAKIGDSRAYDFIMKILKNQNDEFIQTTCIDALAFVADQKDLFDNLMTMLPETKPALQGVLLKTIFAIAYRNNNYNFSLDSNLKNIARNAIFDDDEDISDAGFLALGNSYTEEDISALVHVVLKNSPDMQQIILANLLINSSSDVVAKFICDYAKLCNKDESHIEFFSYLPVVWAQTSLDNQITTVNTIVELLVSGKTYFSLDMIELLIHTSRPLLVDALKSHLDKHDSADIDILSEIINSYGIFELAAVTRPNS